MAERCTSPCRSTLFLNTGSDLADDLAEIVSFRTPLIPCADIFVDQQKIINYSNETLNMLIGSYLFSYALQHLLWMATHCMSFMPSCIQDLGPDSAPCKHPYWAADRSQFPPSAYNNCSHWPGTRCTLSLSSWELQSLALSALLRTFHSQQRHVTSPSSEQEGVSVFSIKNKPRLHCNALFTSVFLFTTKACSSPCSHLQDSAPLSCHSVSWINHSRCPLAHPSHIIQG